MNREFKFRVWNKRTNQWVHGPGYEVNLFGEMILLGGFMMGISLDDLNHCVVLQYTGVKDKNNKEVYEGDIIQCIDLNYLIEWNDYQGKWVARCPYYRQYHHPTLEHFLEIKSCIVIGNIMENPELINDETNSSL